jgi:hypothetical protein
VTAIGRSGSREPKPGRLKYLGLLYRRWYCHSARAVPQKDVSVMKAALHVNVERGELALNSFLTEHCGGCQDFACVVQGRGIKRMIDEMKQAREHEV